MNEKDQQFSLLIKDDLSILRGGVYRIVGNVTDTDDVVQDAMLQAYRRYGSFRNMAALRTWVYRIAVNCAFDCMRKRKREQEAMKNYSDNLEIMKQEPVDEERLSSLKMMVAKLPELYREAIVWGCLSELSGQEAAMKLGCTENTLYQRVCQAKKMLKDMMNKEDGR